VAAIARRKTLSSYLRQKVDEVTGHFANSPRSGERSYSILPTFTE
jgi:hypothetical protein